MSQPRGRGRGRTLAGNSGNSGNSGNAWGNQARREPRQNQQRPSNDQPNNQQRTPNFANSNSFGPALGERARPNRNRDAQPSSGGPGQSWGGQSTPGRENAPAGQPSAWGQSAQPSGSRGPAPSAAQPAPPAQGRPSTSGQPKRAVEGECSGSSTKYHSDEKTRGEAARGAIHGNRVERNDRNLTLIETRPKHIESKKGTTAQRSFIVRSNYFKLNSTIKWEVYHYHVDFSPEIENSAFRNRLLRLQQPRIGSFLYDRGASIYTIRQLESEQFEIVTRDRDEREILIRITRVGLISPREIQFIHLLNVISKKAFKELNLQLIQRDYYDSQARIEIRQHHIELWPGYTTSIRQHESNLLMMAEIKHKLMRTETVLDMLRQCHQNIRQNFKQAFTEQVLGMIVLTRYNNKTYRISDVIFEENPTSTFETRNGPKSYVEYYHERYPELRITDLKQPLLLSTPTERDIRGARGRDEEARPINLIPELCTPTGYTDAMRTNFNLMKDVAVHTRVGPAQRIQKLLDFNRRLQTTPGSVQCFQEWALALDPNLVTVPARQLQWEQICLGGDNKFAAENGAWDRALQGRNSMYVSPDLPDNQWAVVIPQSLQREAEEFVKMIQDVSRGMRFNVGKPQKEIVPDDRSTTLSNRLENICNQNKKLVMVAVSNNQAERYSIIKKVCSVRFAVPSQVVTRRVMDARNISRMRSVATKVAIQMNSKIGGMPWNVNIPMKNIMFVGYDVCHDTRDRSRSFGAVVATMDIKQSTKFFSAVSAHVSGEELSNNLALNVVAALRQYKGIHGQLPDRILFYRDGVGEGQTNYVYEHELRHLLKSLEDIYGEQPVKLAFVIVSKRINTKFFEDRGNNGATNVPPGTVVDDVVTMPERYDFFLVSQAVNQGTATPTNYNVIYDTFGLPPDKLQIMTYKMCHLYFNWAGTTRVPAICQYAHKLAFLVGNYLHTSPARELSEYLYFL